MTGFENPESWEKAKKYAGVVGGMPALFSNAVRTLLTAHKAGETELTPAASFHYNRLLNSASVLSPLYYATKFFRPEELRKHPVLKPVGFTQIFTLEELAGLLALLYLFRRVRKGCDPEEWDKLQTPLNRYMAIGGHLGTAIPNLGMMNGIVFSAFRYIGLGIFLGCDKKNFVKYRRFLRTNKRFFDTEEEYRVWECTHIHIGSILIQTSGLGVDLANGFTQGLSEPDKELPPDSYGYRTRLAMLWIETLLTTGKVPDMTHLGQYYPLRDALDAMLDRVENARQDARAYVWLTKGKDDISPDVTPELFAEPDAAEEIQTDEDIFESSTEEEAPQGAQEE